MSADWADEKAREIFAELSFRTEDPANIIAQALRTAQARGEKMGMERAAEIAFEKIRCDDRTDRWQVANEVAAHIRSEHEGEGK